MAKQGRETTLRLVEYTWHLLRLPDLRRFLAAMMAATRAEMDEEEESF